MERQVTIGAALYTGQRPEGGGERLYADAPALAAAAEAAGFDIFWLSEHHGWADGYLPSPLTLAAAVAAATTTLRVGTGLAIAPLYQPARLAEDAAVVDHLSGGRLVLGLGTGYLPAEFARLGAPWERRGRAVEAAVAHLRRRDPAPLQAHLPVWLGGYAPAAVDRAGRIADGFLVGRAAPGVIEQVSEGLSAHRDPADPAFTFAANVSVLLDEPDAAPASARAGYARQQAAYEAVQREHDAYAGRIARAGGEGLALGGIDAYFQARGGAAEVVEQVAAVMAPAAAWASLHVALRVLFPEPDAAAQVARLSALGERVVPALRARLANPRA